MDLKLLDLLLDLLDAAVTQLNFSFFCLNDYFQISNLILGALQFLFIITHLSVHVLVEAR